LGFTLFMLAKKHKSIVFSIHSLVLILSIKALGLNT